MYNLAVRFRGRGKHSIVRKPQICPKSLTNLDLSMCENRNNNNDVDVHLLHVKSNNRTITVVPLFVTVLLDHYDTYYQLWGVANKIVDCDGLCWNRKKQYVVFGVALIQLKLCVCLIFLIRGYIINDQSTTSLQNPSINMVWWSRELPIVDTILHGVTRLRMLLDSSGYPN